METEKSLDKKITKVLDKIDALYVELEELELKKKQFKTDKINANFKVGKYFSETDGISYTSLIKITLVDAKRERIEGLVVTCDDSGEYSISSNKRVGTYLSQISTKEAFDAQMAKALEFLTKDLKY